MINVNKNIQVTKKRPQAQPVITSSKLTIEALEQGVKYVRS